MVSDIDPVLPQTKDHLDLKKLSSGMRATKTAP